jgi:WD40 repeat protein/serine/threonine protein kinase
MTTDNGNDKTSNDAMSEIARAVGELPNDVLEALQQLPPKFINQLSQLSPEALNQLTRLPIEMLGRLSELPNSMLDWLGRASSQTESGVSAKVLSQFVAIASKSAQPLRTLKSIPTGMLKVMAALPLDVFNSLMELPLELLKQLPDAFSATSETMDEIPTNIEEMITAAENSSVDIAPELLNTLSEMPDGAIQTLAELPMESIATLSELDPELLDTVRQLPDELLEAMGDLTPGGLSTILEMPISAETTLSELDPEVLAQLAADDTPSDTDEPPPKMPPKLLVKLGRLDDGSGCVLGRILAEAKSARSLQTEQSQKSADDSAEAGSDYRNTASTIPEISDNALSTTSESAASAGDNDFDADDSTDHGETGQRESDSSAEGDSSDDAGATVQDVPPEIAALASDASPEDSFEDASIADAWAEGLSALETGEQKPRDRAAMESGDFSQVIDPEGISEDDDSSYGATVESKEIEAVNLDDGSATRQLDDSDDSGADSHGATIQSDDLSGEFAGGFQTAQDEESKTVPTTDSEEDDDSFGETMQSDDGWTGDGLSEFGDPTQTLQDASLSDDSLSQTVESDDDWSADGLSALDPSGNSDDDSFGATVQSDEWSKVDGEEEESFSQTVSLDGAKSEADSDDDDSFGATIQSDPSIGDGGNDDDSFGATIQSDDHTSDQSFSQTIATSDLSPDDRKTMANAWGTGLEDNGAPAEMTVKSVEHGESSAKHTLVITEKQLGTKKIRDYKKGHPFPEPREPEYELLKKLGEGGMGLVFMARQRSIDREVALKMLKPKTAKDPEQRAKFLTEAVVTGDLDHPNIVPIYDVGASPDDALFYAMKKVEGDPWLDVILEKSLEENLDILMSTADAVGFAHYRGVVHRDLKPENVMLGAFNEVLVMDWGLAYSIEGFRKSESITESTSMGGTPAYMAPEMATGPISKIGPRSDVYLLGAILFEIVTGKPPHAGKNAMKCLMSAARNKIRDSDTERAKRNDPTGELLKIAHKAMATKLENRYQTVDELQTGIRDYQSHTESITLTLRALEELREAKSNQDYDLFSRARFGYEEALNLWGANKHAQKGLVDTKFSYALCAQTKGDYDLGMSLLDVKLADHKTLYDELLDAKNTVLARERQLEEEKARRAKMRRVMTIGTVAALIMMSGLTGWAFIEREKAVAQEKEATRQEGIAKLNEKEAVRQKGLAEEQKLIAEKNEQKAVIARNDALEAQKQEEKQRLVAVAAKDEAVKAKTAAELAQKQEEKQRLLAVAAKDEAVKAKTAAELAQEEEAKQRLLAVKAKDEAVKAKTAAELAQKKEAKQRLLAVKAKDEAVKAKTAAELAQKKEAEQRLLAVKAKDEEAKQRLLAVKAKDAAEKAQTAAELAQKEEAKQKLLAVKARDAAISAQKAEQLAREAEEYQAYIARIGLADAKIRENAFEAAIAILDDCPAQLRNWEWGRLMHLCSQSRGTFDNQAPVDAIALAPGGGSFVTGGWNGSATIWDLESGRQIKQLKHDGLHVYSVDWSADGKWIATGSNDGVNGYVQVWNAKTGERVNQKFGDNADESTSHTDDVLSVHFSKSDSESGIKLLTASYDNTARLWDVATGKQERRFLGHTWWVWDAQFSPDESKIVTVSQDGTAIVWDSETGEPGAPFTGHRGPVYSAAFSSDGNSVVTGGYDKRVLVWQPADVRPYDFTRLSSNSGSVIPPAKFRSLDGHEGPVRAVAFSQDGIRIISGGQDNTIRLWNAEGGQLLKTFRGHDGAVRAVAFAESDQVILSGSRDNSIRKWNVSEYAEIRVLQGQVLEGHVDAILSAGFSPDGEHIVTASRDRTARTWEAGTGQQLKVFSEGHSFLATSAAFFPGGKRLATGAVDNTVRIWDVDSGTQLLRLEHTGRAAALATSSDGKLIVTGSDDQTAKIWDSVTGVVKYILKGHKNEVTAVAMSGDGRQILTGDSRGRVILWDVQTQKVVFRLDGGHAVGSRITAAAFLPGTGRVMTACADRTVAQWDIKTGEELKPLILKHPDAVVAMSVRPETHQVVTACQDGSVRLWDADTAQVLGELDRGTSRITHVAIAADGGKALAVDANGRKVLIFPLDVNNETLTPNQTYTATGQLWSAIFAPLKNDLSILALGGSDAKLIGLKSGKRETDETLVSFSPHGVIASASYSPDGSKIVTGSWDFSARVWDSNTGADLRKLAGDDGHTGFVNSAVFSPDAAGRWILTGSDDGTAKLWNTSTGAVLTTLTGHADRVRSAIFSKDGSQVLTSSNDRTARIWTLKETAQADGSMKIEAAVAQVFKGHEWAVLAAEFSDDDKLVITASEDNTARIWSAETGEELSSLAGHTARVTSVAFAPGDNPTRAVTASQDGTVKLWDTKENKEILTLDGHTREVTSVEFSPDGKYVLTASEDGKAILWLTTPWKTAPPKENITKAVLTPVAVGAE